MSESYFGDFLPEELDLVLSIPYRAGVWISHIDDKEGTESDDNREQLALENVLNKIHEKVRDDSFVHEIMREILTHKYHWSDWRRAAPTVMDDLPRAVALVRSRLPAAEAVQYSKSIFHVAKSVALAASERAGAGDDFSKEMVGGKLVAKIADWISSKNDEPVPENISPTERAALQDLMQRLKG